MKSEDKEQNKSSGTLKEAFQFVRSQWHAKWMPLDEMVYISDYMRKHPEKKLTRLLEAKLRHEYRRLRRKRHETKDL